MHRESQWTVEQEGYLKCICISSERCFRHVTRAGVFAVISVRLQYVSAPVETTVYPECNARVFRRVVEGVVLLGVNYYVV